MVRRGPLGSGRGLWLGKRVCGEGNAGGYHLIFLFKTREVVFWLFCRSSPLDHLCILVA